MTSVIQKWGNSLGIRIPNTFVREFIDRVDATELNAVVERVAALIR